MIKFKQKVFFLPAVVGGLKAASITEKVMVGGTALSAVQGHKGNKTAEEQGRLQMKQNEEFQKQQMKQNEEFQKQQLKQQEQAAKIQARAIKQAGGNGVITVPQAGPIQTALSEIENNTDQKMFAGVVSNMGGLAKDFVKLGNLNSWASKGIAAGTLMGAGTYAANKVISHDARKNGILPAKEEKVVDEAANAKKKKKALLAGAGTVAATALGVLATKGKLGHNPQAFMGKNISRVGGAFGSNKMVDYGKKTFDAAAKTASGAGKTLGVEAGVGFFDKQAKAATDGGRLLNTFKKDLKGEAFHLDENGNIAKSNKISYTNAEGKEIKSTVSKADYASKYLNNPEYKNLKVIGEGSSFKPGNVGLQVGFGAMIPAIAYLPQRSAAKSQVVQEERQYSFGSLLKGTANLVSMGALKGSEKLAPMLANSSNAYSRNVGKFMQNHKIITGVGATAVGLGAAAVPWTIGEKLVTTPTKMVDKKAYQFDRTQNKQVE